MSEPEVEEATEPMVALGKEDEIARQILRSSAEASGSGNEIDLLENGSAEDVMLILLGIGMEKYHDLFVKNNINLKTFFQLNEKDLSELGITDAKDRETINDNILRIGLRQKKPSGRENPFHDLQIARNVKNELFLLQNYCSYLELQMRRQKLTDYRVSWKESATKYLKAFAETAIVQAKFLSRRVYCDSEEDHLIGKMLKLNAITLPNHLKEKLMKDKPKRRGKCVAVIFGILFVAVAVQIFGKIKSVYI